MRFPQQIGKILRQMKIFTILMAACIFFSSNFAQTRRKFDCNTEVLKMTDENLGRLSKQQMTEFLLTFRAHCENNAEYSEWSNELLFYTALQQPQLLLAVLSENSKIDKKKIYSEFESPIHDGVNVDSAYAAVKSMKYFTAQRDSVLHHMKIAILKNSMH